MVFGRVIGRSAHWIAVPALVASFLGSCVVFARVWSGQAFTTTLFTWIVAADFETTVVALVDPLTGVMLLVVTGVGMLIHVYSIGYMHDDPGYARFFAYLNLFVFSMTMLVLAGNFLLLYVFWEAVGLCSYLLIGFWYTRDSAAQAGKKAFIVNRVGDFGFGLAIMWIWTVFGTLDYAAVFKGAETLAPATATGIALLLFMGACGKSAQVPLHVWLPDAMEGPTPVSALIHAATMVTAGVYMVARSHVLFERSPVALDVVLWVGVITAVFAATIGLVQTDIKRVLAYSTVSQLGYMFAALGLGAYAAGIFHLVTHAFFKALLFLGAGSVIYGLHGEQVMSEMGGIAPRMLITTVTFLVGAVGLAGLPPIAGFFSKDEILASTFHHEGHRVLWAILLIGVFLTALYTARLVLLAFFGSPRMTKEQAHHIHESPAVMTVPLGVLAILPAAAGIMGVPSSPGPSSQRCLAPVLPFKEAAHGGVASLALAAVSVIAALAGVFVAWLVYGRGQVDASKIGVPTNPLHRLVQRKYYVDEIYDALIVKPIYRLCLWCAHVFDVKVIDGLVNGVATMVVAWALGLRRIQTGYVMNYALGMLLGAVALVAFLLVARP